MENFKLQKYVNEKRIAGLSDKQIATSLGMSLKHLKNLLNEKEPVTTATKGNISKAPVARVGSTFVGGEMKVVPVGGAINFAPKDAKEFVEPKPDNVNPVKPGKKEEVKEQKHGWIDADK
jgi:hypothetical protein